MTSSVLNFVIHVIEKIFQCTSLNTIERVVLLFLNLQYLNSITKGAENVSL